MDALPAVILGNAQEEDPDAVITFQELREVHGVEVWEIAMDVNASGVGFKFRGLYYGGQEGTVQLMTYTTPELAETEEGAMSALRRGLRIRSLEPPIENDGATNPALTQP